MFKKLGLVTLILLLSACARTPDWDYDQSVQFSNFKTFAWSQDAKLDDGNEAYQVSDLMEKRVRQAIKGQLEMQGLRLVDSSVADLRVNFEVAVETKLDLDTFSIGYGARWHHWGFGYDTHTTAREYKVGTLVIDIIDNKSNQLIWRGAQDGRLRKNQTPNERTLAVNATVAEILANFPPHKISQ